MTDMSSQTSSVPQLKVQGIVVQCRRAVFYGWWIVAASAVGLFWGPSVTVYSFSVFLKPLMQEFRAGRAAVSLGITLHHMAGAVCAPIVGWLVDRYGSRRVILSATAMFAWILLSNKLFSANIWHLYVFYLAIGVIINGVGPIPYGNLVSRWFDRRRGLALGLTMIGLGAGAMIMPSLAQQLIIRFGWRTAYAALGCGVLFIAFPVVAAVLREKPQDLGLLPDGAAPKNTMAGSRVTLHGLAAHDAWHSGTFWLMVCAFFCVSLSVQGCLVHTTAMLSDRGIPVQTAALGSSLVGAAVLLGRVGTGYLLDRLFAPRVAAIFFAGAALGIGLLWLGTTPLAFAGAFLVGLGLGAEVDLIAYLVSRYFGLRDFGKVYSSAFAAFVLAGALGPLLMGASFDRTGSYRGALIAFLAATLVAAALMTRLGPYRYRAGQFDDRTLDSREATQSRNS
jgi:MFS family permease